MVSRLVAAGWIGLGFALVLFASAEAILRVTAPDTDGVVSTDAEAFKWRAPAPYLVYQASPNADVELRVFLLGGSKTVEGMRNETTICGYLEPRIGYPTLWMVREDAIDRGLHAARSRRDLLAQTSLWRIVLSRSRVAVWLFPRLSLEDTLTSGAVADVESEHERPGTEEVTAHLLSVWNKMRIVSEALGASFFAVLQPVSPSDRGALRSPDDPVN